MSDQYELETKLKKELEIDGDSDVLLDEWDGDESEISTPGTTFVVPEDNEYRILVSINFTDAPGRATVHGELHNNGSLIYKNKTTTTEPDEYAGFQLAKQQPMEKGDEVDAIVRNGTSTPVTLRTNTRLTVEQVPD